MSEKVKSNFNDVTGETIASVKGNQKAYESGWERIFGKKENEHPHSNSGVRYTGMTIPDTPAATQVAHKITQDDVEVSVETPNGKVVVEGYVSPHPLLGLGTKLGIEYGDGLEYQEMVREGILSQPEFKEELLPEGIIGDEV